MNLGRFLPAYPQRLTSLTQQASGGKVYEVAEILARSLEQEPNEQGRPEYFYIVRWDGYGPRDDTWEPRSNVMVGSSRLVQEFDAKRECSPSPCQYCNPYTRHSCCRDIGFP